jgi:Ca2+/Na+ antiporter
VGSKPATPEVPFEDSTSTEPDSVTPPEFDFELSLGLSFYLAYHVYQLYLTFTKKVDDKTEKAITEDTTRKTKNNTTKMTSPLLLLMTLAPILPTTHSLPLGSTLSLLLPYPFLALGIQALLFLSILLLFISIRTAVCAMQILAPSALERCPTPATKITTINSLTKTGFRNSPYSLTAAPVFAIVQYPTTPG